MGRRGMVGIVAALVLAAAALMAPAMAHAFGPLGSFGSEGAGAGQMSAPGAIAVGPENNFFVADNGNDRVDVFAPGGVFLYAFGKGVGLAGGDVCDQASGCQGGEGGDEAGALERPEGIAVSGAGDVYVGEEGNDRVSVFTAAGAFKFAFGYHVGPASANVCTAGTGCKAGSNLREPEIPELFTQVGPEGALSEPIGIAIDSSGRVFVAEAGNNRVSAFDPEGKFLYTFGWEVEGKEPFANVCKAECIEGFGVFVAGAMEKPTGIGTMPGGLLAISDAGNHRIDVFGTKGEFIRAFGKEVVPAGGNVCNLFTGCQAGAAEGTGALGTPAGLAVGADGAVSVGDVEFERVSQFDPNGEFARAFGAGVLSGADAFEICTAVSGCLTGSDDAGVLGATPQPFGVATACGGSLFVTGSTSGVSRVASFGEPGSLEAFCPPPEKPAPPDPGGAVDDSPPAQTPPPAATPSNAFQLAGLKRDRKQGTATLAVGVPGTGQLTLGGRGIKSATLTVGAAATVSLPVSLVGGPRRDLLADGYREVTAKITFLPSGGTARTRSRWLTLVKRPKTEALRPR